MSDSGELGRHLSDKEIRAYWRERLSEEDERRVEEHYLECLECQARVRDAERQSQAASPRAWAWAAAAAVVVGIGLYSVWPWFEEKANRRPAPIQGGSQPPTTGMMAVVHLAPPTRNDSATIVTPAGRMVFALDAREAGAGGTRFDVTLSGPDGAIALTTPSAESSANGEVRVAVETAQLRDGPYAFELRAGSLAVGYSFLIRR
jgi:hypothetical protein